MAKSLDLTAVRAVLERDRRWSAFALADLAVEHRDYCEWHLAEDGPGLALVYRGFSPPLLFAMGSSESVLPLLGEVTEPELYVSVKEQLLSCLTGAGYRLHEEKTFYRMVLGEDIAQPAIDARAERLGKGDYEDLVRLFEDGDATGERPPFFRQSSLASGIYYGVREAAALTAATGTLVFAPEESVACLGNVYTRRDRRGRGLARMATAAVTAELLQRGIQTIALNVRIDNPAAIRIYEQLGFSRYCEYREARAVRANSPGDPDRR